MDKRGLNIGQEFVIGGFTPGSHGIDALVVRFHSGDALMYAARVRAGLVPTTRRELYARLKPLIAERCPLPYRQPADNGTGAADPGLHVRTFLPRAAISASSLRN